MIYVMGINKSVPYVEHIYGVSKVGKVIKAGGWVGVALGASASGLKVKETCRGGTEEACRKVRFTEGGKFGGSLTGGALEGAVGGGACLAIGATTLGVGGIVCGLVLVGVGTSLGIAGGELVGEDLGEIIYEGIYP